MPYITKGTRVRAEWFQANNACLAGAQPKFGADLKIVIGTVRHVRGDRPDEPSEVWLMVDPDDDSPTKGPTVRPPRCTCPNPHIAVRSNHVIEILPEPTTS